MGIRNLLVQRNRAGSSPPFLLHIRSAKWFIVSVCCVAVFTDIFLYGIVVPVIPFALSQRAGIPEQNVQHWVSVLLAVYGAGLLVISPLCGWLADKSPSRRLPLLVGLLALAGATAMLCAGSSIGILVTGRLLQGFSAAIVWTTGLALLVDTVGQKGIGQAMGYVSFSMSIAYLIAPLLGGIVYARAGYYSVYYMSFGVIALDVLLRLALIEKKVAVQWAEPDPQQRSVRESEKPPLLPSSSHQHTYGSTETQDRPDLPPPTRFSSLPPVFTLLASPRLLAALWGCLVEAALMTVFDSVLPLRVNAIFGWSSTAAGLIFLALVVPAFLAPILGYLSDQYGPRWLATVGFALSCPCFVLLRFVDHNSLGQKVLLCALLALLGVCLTMTMTPLMAEISYVVEAKEKESPGAFGKKGAYAQAYGLFNTAFAGGTLVGPLWGGFVVAEAGWSTMTWTLGLLAVASAIPAAIWTGGLITKRHSETARWNHQGSQDVEITAEALN